MELHHRSQWGFRETNRVAIYECIEFEASVHWAVIDGNFMPFFHLEVFEPWTPRMFRHAKRTFDRWISDWKQFPMFTMADEDSEVLDRLREHFGFTFFKEIPCSDGKNRRLFVHYGPSNAHK